MDCSLTDSIMGSVHSVDVVIRPALAERSKNCSVLFTDRIQISEACEGLN